MKYIKFVLISTLFLHSIASFAQGNIKIGVEIGPSIVSLRGNEIAENNDAALRMVAGLSLEYLISKKVSIKSGLFYERKGTKFKTSILLDQFGNPVNESENANSYFDYLSVPFMVKYRQGDRIKFFINSGPYLGYLLKSTSEIEGQTSFDTTDLNKKLDVGLSAGIGIEFSVGEKVELMIEARDNLGLLNISKVQITNDNSLKTNSLNFLFSVIYKI